MKLTKQKLRRMIFKEIKSLNENQKPDKPALLAGNVFLEIPALMGNIENRRELQVAIDQALSVEEIKQFRALLEKVRGELQK